MHYEEQSPPDQHAWAIKSAWTLTSGGSPDGWTSSTATPDGCIELVWRHCGRSRWNGEQPPYFVVGINRRPVEFQFTEDAHFSALRIWPWVWAALSPFPVSRLNEGWADAKELGLTALADPGDDLMERIASSLGPIHAIKPFAQAILASPSVAQLREASGLAPRQLQRWFARHVGMAPRAYLDILRFQASFASLDAATPLAAQAVDGGYSDQPHMTRKMRAHSGLTPASARQRSVGPFYKD